MTVDSQSQKIQTDNGGKLKKMKQHYEDVETYRLEVINALLKEGSADKGMLPINAFVTLPNGELGHPENGLRYQTFFNQL